MNDMIRLTLSIVTLNNNLGTPDSLNKDTKLNKLILLIFLIGTLNIYDGYG